MNNHIPVLLEEVLEYLDPKPNQNFIDCTIGGGGHAIPILERIVPNGRVLGIDWDSQSIEILKSKFTLRQAQGINFNQKDRLILEQGNFADLKNIAEKHNFKPIHGILFDLGMSSYQLEKSGRGFSFLRDEPLNMNYESGIMNHELTADRVINFWQEKELERILSEYGEEEFAKRIAREITKERKFKQIKNTFRLVEIIRRAVPSWYKRRRIHPATKTFQALRIAVNDELNNIKKALPQALEILEPGGRIVVISFHSLEDRIIKHFFKTRTDTDTDRHIRTNSAGTSLFYDEDHSRDAVAGDHRFLKILTKKPITPTSEEIKNNPRSRSAKLRAAIKISNF